MQNAVNPISNDTISSDREIFYGDQIGFRFAVTIFKPRGVIDQVLQWCQTEMSDGDWRWQLVSTSGQNMPGRYIFFFNCEADYSLFLLKWR